MIGRTLAARMGCAFLEGDDLHSAASIVSMRDGLPLDDADRAPWLDAIGAWIAARAMAGSRGVVTCSALRRRYRDRLRRSGGAALRFVLLDPPRETLERRLRERTGHFMPASLLASQIATLEPPDDEHDVLVLRETDGIEAIRDTILKAWL